MVDTATAFGRGTAAGNLLHKLYHKPSKPSTFDAELAARLAHMRELREAEENPKPKVIPKSRAKVKVPRMTGRRPRVNADEIPTCSAYYRPNRKPEYVIKAEMEAEPTFRLPPINQKHIGPKEKERFAQWMEFDGDIPQVPPPRQRPPTPPPQPDLDVKELFDAIVDEIQERKDFLEEMRSLGRGLEVEAKIKQEISQRVVELKKLDRIIKAEPKSLK